MSSQMRHHKVFKLALQGSAGLRVCAEGENRRGTALLTAFSNLPQPSLDTPLQAAELGGTWKTPRFGPVAG
jgi:hypothetical protein